MTAKGLTEISVDLERLPAVEVTRMLQRLDTTHAALAFRLLPKDRALEAFEDLAPSTQRALLRGLRSEQVAELIHDLDPDDRARLVDELPAKVATQLLSGLDPHERAMTQELLGYPPGSAGRVMTPEVAWIPEGLDAAAGLERLREQSFAETIYMVPVIGLGRVLVGVVSLRSLVSAAAHTPVEDLVSAPVAVYATQDQEVAARLIRDHGMIGLPVVDAEDRLLGVITVDDAMRILQEAEDEDAARAGGTEPLAQGYLATPILGVVRSRIVWLLILIAAATLTVNVLDYFEETLASVVSLALFIPLLIGTGGNTGAQTVSTVVRAMATDTIGVRDLPRVAGREMLTGALLGALLAAIGFLPAALLVGRPIAFVLALALLAVCTLATTAGAVIPLLARRTGIDPAVVSAPVITTLVDSTGLVIYFLIAHAVLGL